MITLTSYLADEWRRGHGQPVALVHATTEEPLAQANADGLDLGAAVRFAREVGGPALRAMTFAQRGEALKKLADTLAAHRDELLKLAMDNGGNTRGDAKFDVDGAIGTLAAYADLCRSLGDVRYLVDGDAITLGRSSRLSGQHFLVPRMGVAAHINAFNFPAWGLIEKAATALAAGMPFIAKPATATALVAWRMMQLMVDSGSLPSGTAQLIVGSVGDLLDHLGAQDVVAFTGSSDTAVKLRTHPRLVAKGTPLNVEADSLNVALVGPDVARGTPAYELMLKDVVREITQKTGQKCTAIRRILVSEASMDHVSEDLVDRLAQHKVGNPVLDQVTMGPLATAQQKRDVLAGLLKLQQNAQLLLGGPGDLKLVGADANKGFFVMPTLLRAANSDAATYVHAHEVFGPVATLLAYRDTPHALALAARGEGGLVASIYSDDKAFCAEALWGLAPHHGRICVGGEKVAGHALSPGMVLPTLVHGGPGRAGGGEELGGLRGMQRYMQRVAVQAFGPWLESLAGAGRKV
jgi:oxepin-CoA hydrolase/3-oxo-5,6-dehydrosuberyl-CoA semialdehyde dehydrogenase